MSEINPTLQEQQSLAQKNLILKNNKSTKISNFNKIFSKRSKPCIIISKTSNKISLDISSMVRIFSLNQLNYNEYVNFLYDKEKLNIKSENHSLIECAIVSKNKNEFKKMDEETEYISNKNTIKEDVYLKEQKNKNAFDTSELKKNENIFDPDFPLLNNKIINTFSNIDNFPQKYLSLIICGNKAIISLDYLKCIYPTISCCGIFNLLYFINILFTINTELNLSFHYFLYIPLALLLTFTGVYGYEKVKKNIYDNEFCITLTNICTIAPIFSFALSLIHKEEITKGQLVVNFIINFVSCFFSFCCIIILKEAERMENCEKEIIIQN